MNFLQQTYKGKYDWWRWLLILGVFIPPFFRSYLTELLKQVFKLPLEKQGNNLILELSSYIILLPLLLVTIQYLHQRSFSTFITNRKTFDWVRFFLSFATWGVFIILLLVISFFYSGGAEVWNFKMLSFIKLLVICLLLVPIRAFFEDILFKGYFLQSLICFLKTPWIALLVNTLVTSIFMHLMNSYLFNLVGFHILLYYFLVNFLTGLIIILDDGLEIVLGMKVGNNLSILLFTTLEIYTNHDASLLQSKTGTAIVIITYVSIYLGFPLYYLFLQKMYGWHNWKEKLLHTRYVF